MGNEKKRIIYGLTAKADYFWFRLSTLPIRLPDFLRSCSKGVSCLYVVKEY